TLKLQRERPAKLQRRGQQHGRGDGLAKQLSYRLRVVLVCAQLAPRALEANPMAADRAILDDEATDFIAGASGLLIHAPTMGHWNTQLNRQVFSSTARSAASDSPSPVSPSSPAPRRNRTACPCPRGTPPAAPDSSPCPHRSRARSPWRR